MIQIHCNSYSFHCIRNSFVIRVFVLQKCFLEMLLAIKSMFYSDLPVVYDISFVIDRYMIENTKTDLSD